MNRLFSALALLRLVQIGFNSILLGKVHTSSPSQQKDDIIQILQVS